MANERPDLGGELKAWIREGAKDLHNAIVPAFPESQHGVDEIGTPTSPTPAMVHDSLGGYEALRNSYARSAEQGQEREHDLELEQE